MSAFQSNAFANGFQRAVLIVKTVALTIPLKIIRALTIRLSL